MELISEASERGQRVVLYTHRKMLADQLSRVMDAAGIDHGRRAAGHRPALIRDIQLSSVQTERRRVYEQERWNLHDADLVLIDECHCHKSETARQILQDHSEARILGFSATPYGVGDLYDTMIRMAKMQELRDCGALVPALHYGPDEPDTRHIKRTKTGEYTYRSVTRVLRMQTVWGRIWEWWQRLNPEGQATLVFCPGVAESLWMAQEFQRHGIVSAHIDGESIWCEGQEMDTSTESRDMVAEGSMEGHIQVVCNRFVLREGIDWPWIRHGILATVFGSPQSYIQSCGRLLRASLGKRMVTIQDHGGNWWRHGSVNVDRQWDLSTTVNQHIEDRAERIREGLEPEPIVCPQCAAVRNSGPVCPECGYQSPKRVRKVLQKNGKLVEHAESCFPHRPTTMKNDTQREWEQMYWRFRNSRRKPNFRQAYGFFVHTHRYRPPINLKYMPIDPRDWHKPIVEVPRIRLHGFELTASEV